MYSYTPAGVCSQQIFFYLVGGVVKNVRFIGGCPGNLQGISRLVEGMDAAEVIQRIEGIQCGGKPTSCPDQFSKALKQALETEQN